jgi:hypothetical protein
MPPHTLQELCKRKCCTLLIHQVSGSYKENFTKVLLQMLVLKVPKLHSDLNEKFSVT